MKKLIVLIAATSMLPACATLASDKDETYGVDITQKVSEDYSTYNIEKHLRPSYSYGHMTVGN